MEHSRFNLSRWALEHQPLTRFLLVALLLGGIFAYSKLGQDEVPPFTFRAMVVQAFWPGATAEQMSRQVTDKIEKALQEVPYAWKIRSYSKPGETLVTFQLADTSPAKETQQLWYTVRKKVGDIAPTLPQGVRGPFEESFPGLVKFLDANRVKLPAWLKPGMACPWRTRAEFLAAAKGKQMTELRDLLATTVALQSRFLAQRMEAALPKLLAATSAARRAHVKKQFEKLAANGKGTFALIDYVNFKGEGTKPEERYNGRGWGLLQVIEGMDDEGSIAESFAASAARVLAQRVKNSPPERDEAKWLPGWVRRVEAYAR